MPPTFDAGSQVCVKIDLSTYDDSCQSDSDCMSIATTACQNCACTNATINVDGRDRYNATLAQLPPAVPMDSCFCPNEQPPKCEQGICTYGNAESVAPWWQ